jgi:hypothetical protein
MHIESEIGIGIGIGIGITKILVQFPLRGGFEFSEFLGVVVIF